MEKIFVFFGISSCYKCFAPLVQLICHKINLGSICLLQLFCSTLILTLHSHNFVEKKHLIPISKKVLSFMSSLSISFCHCFLWFLHQLQSSQFSPWHYCSILDFVVCLHGKSHTTTKLQSLLYQFAKSLFLGLHTHAKLQNLFKWC